MTSLCTWYINTRKVSSNYYFMPEGQLPIKLMLIYGSTPRTSNHISDYSSTPSSYLNGSWANVEYAILRKAVPSGEINTFREQPSMYITYENSMSYTHDHADQTSFTFFFKGKQFLLDVGYCDFGTPNWYWGHSPYAHNMVVVCPDKVMENSVLGGTNTLGYHYRPQGESPQDNNPVILDPAVCRYFYKDVNYDILKTSLKYLNSTSHYDSVIDTLFNVDLDRTIIRDGELYFVFDDLNADNHQPYSYWNLLQLASSSTALNIDGTHGLTLTNLVDKVDIMQGSDLAHQFKVFNPPPTISYLPLASSWSLYGCESSASKHYRTQTEVYGIDPSFVTVIAPRPDSGTNSMIVENVKQPDVYFGTKVRSKSHSNSAIDCFTFTGCGKNSIYTAIFSSDSIRTDSKYFLVTLQNSNPPNSIYKLDNTFALFNGNFLKVDNKDVYHCYTSGNQIVSAVYEPNRLHIEFKRPDLEYPRFKIYRNGLEPVTVSAGMSYYADLAIDDYVYTDPNQRNHATDVINSLAYDDEFFYVNYSYQDLIAEPSLGQNLVLYTGNYRNLDINRILSFGTGELTINGYMDIEAQGNVTLMENTVIRLNPNTLISIHGTLSANNSQLLNYAAANWEGIRVESNGKLEMNNCEIENTNNAIICYGELSLIQCNIHHGMNGVILSRPGKYLIDNCQINNFSDYGMRIIDAFSLSQRLVISNTEIKENDIGVLCFNSNPYFEKVSIHNNANSGLWTSHNSSPAVKNCSFYDNRTLSTDYPEIFMDSESYPVFLEGNDIIPEHHGFSIYYQRYPDRLRAMKCIRNYWNLFTEQEIRGTIYPTSDIWHVGVSPFLDESANGYEPQLPAGKFYLGLQKEMVNNKSDARELYIASLQEDYGKSESFWSMEHIVQCIEPGTIWDKEGTLSYVQAIADTSSDRYVKSLAQQLTSYCSRMLSNYDSAIDGYAICMQDCQTDVDSLCFMLDMVHTYMEAQQDSSRSAGPILTVAGMSIKDLKEAYILEETLLNQLKNKIEYSSLPIPAITCLKLDQNYPNPFNPETTINFSILKEGRVTLEVYNIKGQKVNTVTDNIYEKGRYEVTWNGKDQYGKRVASGLYLYRINSNGQGITRKMLMLK